MLFDFMSMAGTLEERKVDRYEKDNLLVSTVRVTDSNQPYETAVQHPKYNDDKIIIVDMYNSIEEAEKGHKKWVENMTAKKIPEKLVDVSTSEIMKLCDAFGTDDDWKTKKKGGNS